MVDDTGGARLCDFGRSKILDHRGFTTVFSGSARFMAPELLGVVPASATNPDQPESLYDTNDDSFEPVLTKETDVYGFSMVALEVQSRLCLLINPLSVLPITFGQTAPDSPSLFLIHFLQYRRTDHFYSARSSLGKSRIIT